MKCDTRALTYQWWSEHLKAQQTGGSTCMQAQPQELFTFDTYPQSRSLNRMLNDDQPVVDNFWWHFTLGLKDFPDTVVMADDWERVVHYERTFVSSVVPVDAFQIDVKWIRRFYDDPVVITDAVKFYIRPAVKQDIVVMDDALTWKLHKVFADTVMISDSFTNGHNQAESDSVTVTDHGAILSQSYFDHTGSPNGYFAADYFGYGYTW